MNYFTSNNDRGRKREIIQWQSRLEGRCEDWAMCITVKLTGFLKPPMIFHLYLTNSELNSQCKLQGIVLFICSRNSDLCQLFCFSSFGWNVIFDYLYGVLIFSSPVRFKICHNLMKHFFFFFLKKVWIKQLMLSSI